MGEAGFWGVVRERLASAPFLSSLGLQRAQEEGRVCQEHGALGKPYTPASSVSSYHHVLRVGGRSRGLVVRKATGILLDKCISESSLQDGNSSPFLGGLRSGEHC